MANWKCRLDDASRQRFREELQLQHINDHIEVPGEHDLPRSHVRQLAVDALMVLARQEQPEVDPARLHRLMEELQMICEPVTPEESGPTAT